MMEIWCKNVPGQNLNNEGIEKILRIVCTKEHDFKIPSMIETIMRYYNTYWSDKKDDSVSLVMKFYHGLLQKAVE